MGLTHLDGGVLVGFLDANDAHHESSRSVLAEAVRDSDQLSIAASALAECLVGPARRSRSTVETVLQVISDLPVAVIDLDPEIATEAAFLRARHGSLRVPDALVIATATILGAERLVTTDGRWPTQPQ